MCCSSFDIKECHLTAFTILSMFSFLASSHWFAEKVLMGHLTGYVDFANFCFCIFVSFCISSRLAEIEIVLTGHLAAGRLEILVWRVSARSGLLWKAFFGGKQL